MAENDTNKDEKPADDTTEEVEAEETPDEKPSDAVAEEESSEETGAEASVEDDVEVEEEEEEKGPSAFDKVAALTSRDIRTDRPEFRSGDTVKVHVKIIEGSKERIQVFEGVVIAIKHGGMDKTFKVRKNSWGVGVERTFFINSPKVDRIEVVRRGRVRRAKLYYLRDRAGKAARIKERRQVKK